MKQQKVEQLAQIRRFEAAGFRAWPATSVQYEGTWAIRLTASHPSWRLNSVNPLDPADDHRIAERIGKVARTFQAYGRPVTFRISPLCPPALTEYFDAQGWTRWKPSTVMRLSLSEEVIAGAMHQIPLKDLSRFVSAAFKVHGYAAKLRPGFTEVISSIKPEAGLFILEEDDVPVASAICVHEGSLAGLFEVATAKDCRGKGFGRRMLLSALKWAHSRGATEAWLQVHDDNDVAINLYHSLGFVDIYKYHYRRPPAEDGHEG